VSSLVKGYCHENRQGCQEETAYYTFKIQIRVP
jgi:hypothetical protein